MSCRNRTRILAVVGFVGLVGVVGGVGGDGVVALPGLMRRG